MAEELQGVWQHIDEFCVNQAGDRDGGSGAVGSHDAVQDTRAALGHKVGAVRGCRADQRSDCREGVPFLFGAAELEAQLVRTLWMMTGDGAVQLGNFSEEQDLWFVWTHDGSRRRRGNLRG